MPRPAALTTKPLGDCSGRACTAPSSQGHLSLETAPPTCTLSHCRPACSSTRHRGRKGVYAACMRGTGTLTHSSRPAGGAREPSSGARHTFYLAEARQAHAWHLCRKASHRVGVERELCESVPAIGRSDDAFACPRAPARSSLRPRDKDQAGRECRVSGMVVRICAGSLLAHWACWGARSCSGKAKHHCDRVSLG